MSYTVVKLLRDDFVATSDLRYRYKVLSNKWDGTELASTLLNLQIDRQQAGKLFDAIQALYNEDQRAALEILQLLVDCAKFAVRDFYNTSAKATAVDSGGVFVRVSEFVRNTLGYEPNPIPLKPTHTGGEDKSRAMARARDCYTENAASGAPCVITGLPHAQMGHLIPVSSAGAISGHRWFWLLMVVLLPKPVFDTAWSLAGGARQHSLTNVMMLCQPLHRMYDDLHICFLPILNKSDPEAVPFALELHVPRRLEVNFYYLKSMSGQRIAHMGLYTWKPFEKATQAYAPSPLLLSLHRYMCYTRVSLFPTSPNEIVPPPPAPLPWLKNPLDVQEQDLWDRCAGSPRSKPATPRSTPPVSPQSSSGLSPLFQSMAGNLSSRMGMDGHWDYGNGEDDDDDDDVMSQIDLGPSAMEDDGEEA